MRTGIALRGSIALVAIICAMFALLTSPSQAAPTPNRRCEGSNLSLGHGQAVSPVTSEQGDNYTLTNRGKFTCYLFGYPGVSLYDSKGHALPFRYTRARSPYIGPMPPSRVILHPGEIAYFKIAKSTCVVGEAVKVRDIRVYPPNTKKQLVTRAFDKKSGGAGELWYCKGGLKDHGQIVYVSPIAKNLRSLWPAT